MERKKIGQGYMQSGYGRDFKRGPIIWLINGRLYAKDKQGAKSDFRPLDGELDGYVRVNKVFSCGDTEFWQCGPDDHKLYQSKL